ncbi:hypothetical protein RRG08_004878 [Elysia crispata]|uniref:Uncharacterized protein n=1 Tax=Elysia crispata TaxID=231223 RepID=A0AAE0ZIP6_9GAST|nr:hypothetical protein RRG08_004878 [Elysia crispata]
MFLSWRIMPQVGPDERLKWGGEALPGQQCGQNHTLPRAGQVSVGSEQAARADKSPTCSRYRRGLLFQEVGDQS